VKPYFNSEERLLKLRGVAASWIETPFEIGASVRGAGVDCVRFVAEVLKECGQIPGYEFPSYTIDGGNHLKRSLVEAWLLPHPLFLQLSGDPADLMPGDVLEFRIGRGVAHHVGLFGGWPLGNLWSAMGNDGVRVRTLRDGSWGRRLTRCWRPLESEGMK